MCGSYGHGWWWQDKATKDYVVVASWEINSHKRQKEVYPAEIPGHANKWGFNPVSGEPATNDIPLPDEIKTKICLLIDMWFPDPPAIARWILANYDKYGDAEEWDLMLPDLLSDGGIGLFSPKWWADKPKRWAEESRRYAGKSDKSRWYADECKWHAGRFKESKRWPNESKRWAEESRRYAGKSKRYADKSKWWATNLKYCNGKMDVMDIDKFISYFLAHPNKFWQERRLEPAAAIEHQEGELIKI